MTVINNPNCILKAGNTGVPECTIDPKEIIGAILIPATLALTTTDIETTGLVSVLQTKSILEAVSARVFPFYGFEEIADNSEDIVKVTRGYGNTRVTRDGKYNWTFTFTEGGVMYNKELRKFNFVQDRKVLFVDKTNNIWGVSDGAAGMKGISLDYVHFKPWKVNDASTPTSMMVEFGMANASELNDEVVFVATGENLPEVLKGCLDVTLTKIASAATTITIKLATKYGQVDLYDFYSTEIAANAAWLVTKAGVVVTPVSTAAVAATKSWLITLTAPTGAHVFALEDPTALAVLNVGGTPEVGYEGDNTISHTF